MLIPTPTLSLETGGEKKGEARERGWPLSEEGKSHTCLP